MKIKIDNKNLKKYYHIRLSKYSYNHSMKLTKKLIEDLTENTSKFAKTLSEQDLEDILRKLSEVYYNTDKSLVNDDIFDLLKNELKKKNSKNPFLTEVGAPVKGTKEKVKLPYPMGSLNKVYPNTDDLAKWTKKYKGIYVVSDKLDGASAQIYKDDKGKLYMYSRGDGEVGQNISHLLNVVNVPKTALEKMPNDCSVRGELIMSKKNFKKVKGKENPRNTVAGLINSKTVDREIAKLTDFIAYSVLHPRYKQNEQMKLLNKWTFDTVEYKEMKVIDDDKLEKYLVKRREESDYEMDGLVCVDSSDKYKSEAGYPTHAVAFKISGETVDTKVVRVIWTASMDKYLKPKIEIEPVKLLGTTITYATAFNAKFVEDNKIGKGAIVKITRGGDVIPDIVEVVKPAKQADMPTIKYKWNKTNVDIIAVDLDDETKTTVTIHIIDHFFKTLDVKYISIGTVTKLVENGYDDLFKILGANKDELVDIEGIGEKMIIKIYKEIEEKLASTTLPKLMSASREFGRGLGERKIKEIIAVYPDILTLKATKEELKEMILEIDGFSDILSEKFVENLKSFKKFFNKLNEYYDVTYLLKAKKQVKKGKQMLLNGEKIVFTGFRDAELQKFIEDNGGKVSTSVSSNTTILIHADNADTSTSKFKKATDLGTKLYSKTAFMKKYKV
uniref:DNA ligase (NAD(+)) n=1 Tax=viral metagenome TaxID=1070528 RepID=A0A6C0EAL8_9ZZZZ